MKTIIAILCGMTLAVGCSRQTSNPPAKQTDTQYENLSLDWLIEDTDAIASGFTNHCLVIITAMDATTNTEYIDVHSLDETANILGKYGWHLVNIENDGGWKIWHMERQARRDHKRFDLVGSTAAQLKLDNEKK